ncbi:MAG: hypothetical protein ABFD08_17090 [Syntrophomonas sp.]
MKKRWGKGEPVNLSDLLKITPVANEIIQLSEELDMSSTDVMWIVAQIIDNNNEDINAQHNKIFDDEDISGEEEWGDVDLENLEDEIDQAAYSVSVKVNSGGRFPEIAFKAGINSKEDINYFFDMVMEMLDKLD